MSSNRLVYDECAQINQNRENKNQLNWVMDNGRFENDNNCMIDLGVNGGNTSSNNRMLDRIDIETKLLGIGNFDSKCKGMSKIDNVNNVLPQCNFYNGQLKPANLSSSELTNNKCNNSI